MARQRAAAACEQAKAVIQARSDLCHRQHRDARRRQLDGQRNAVQAPADLGQRCGVLGIELEVGQGEPGAIDEDANRLGLQHR